MTTEYSDTRTAYTTCRDHDIPKGIPLFPSPIINPQYPDTNPIAAATEPPNICSPTPTKFLDNLTPNNDNENKMHFIHKTLNYVLGQLSVTTAISVLMFLHKSTCNNFIDNNPGTLWLPIIMSFITLICMFTCNTENSRNVKKTMFWLFTLAISALVGVSVIQYTSGVILNATITLLMMVTFINIYAYNQAKSGSDFTYLGPCLLGMLLMIITLSVVNIFLHCSFLELTLAGISVIVFSLLLVYDLNRLYNGREMRDMENPDYLLSAINIYLDIINIFLNLLTLFSGSNKQYLKIIIIIKIVKKVKIVKNLKI